MPTHEEVQRIAAAFSLLLLLYLSAFPRSTALPPDFISIDCGSLQPEYNDSRGIRWVSDNGYIRGGAVATVQSISPGDVSKQLMTLRYFPDSNIQRFCYVLGPVWEQRTYLIRASFLYGNYDNKNKPPVFDLYFNANMWDTVDTADYSSKEMIMVATGTSIAVCVVRATQDIPFISSLELRLLESDMYRAALSTGVVLFTIKRLNFGAASSNSTRYPEDTYDRIWEGDTIGPSLQTWNQITTTKPDLPPSAVMKTARTSQDANSSVIFGPYTLSNGKYYIAAYYAELENISNGMREFQVSYSDCCRGNTPWRASYDFGDQIYAALEDIAKNYNVTQPFRITLIPLKASKLPPLLNALEILQYSYSASMASTDATDVKLVNDIKKSLGLENWTGDPCIPDQYQYDWLLCSPGNTPRITTLLLSNRNLTGQLPGSIGEMTELTKISLDNNQLTGSIPDLSRLTKLQSLDLQSNHLSGAIPDFLGRLPNLKELFLQVNNFSGMIPSSLVQDRNLNFQFENNQYLCQPGNSSCSFVSTEQKSNNAIVIASVVGSVIALMIAIYVIIYCARRWRLKTTPVAAGSHQNPVLHDSNQGAQVFTYNEIKSATNEFSKKIGEGGFGPVFYGKFSDGQQVAVKVLSSVSNHGLRQFVNEVSLLSKVHHRNLVSFLGYCNELENILVYEYMSRGDLRSQLYGLTASSNPLSWKARLSIALNAAQGVEYLHIGCSPTIIHRDIKSSNILIDDNLQAKVADFGISKVKLISNSSHTSTVVMGTHGYLDPEYYATNWLTEKSDVYSFGVVLLEIICGRAPIDNMILRDRWNICEWARPLIGQGNIKDIVDPCLYDSYNPYSMQKMASIAFMCTEPQSSKRPSMSKVVEDIRKALEIETGLTSIFNLSVAQMSYGSSSNSGDGIFSDSYTTKDSILSPR